MELTNNDRRDLYQFSLYRSSSFTYDSLVIENTNRCTAKCAICYQAAGGDSNKDRLDVNVAKKCIREAAKLDCIGKRFHLAGGESFIYMDDCRELFSCAKKAGYKKISCTTNAFWCKNFDNAQRVCESMRKNGLDHMEISWDYWHYQFVSPEAINNCIRACFENEITTNLRLLATKKHKMNEVMDLLDVDAVKLVDEISSSQVSAVGRAAALLNEEDLYYAPGGLNATCDRSLCVSVNARGFVAPCCSGIDQCDEYVNGNIYNESIVTIVKRMNEDPILRRLVFMGIKSFFPIFKECGINYQGKNTSPCKICAHVFSKRENIEAIKDCIKRQNFENLKKLLANIVGSNG